MCGIAGFIDNNQRLTMPEAILQKMAQSLHHRGPDHQGVWFDANVSVGLAHARLTILDLSERSNQPIFSPSGRYCVAYNGEIYNYKDLTQSQSVVGDTEALLCTLDKWGVEETLPRLNGMFAIAIWDRATQKLYLVRDSVGMKPLYYGWHQSVFVWGSELKAIRCLPNYKLELNMEAIAMQHRYSYIPAPLTCDKGIKKLLPGHYWVLDRASGEGKEIDFASIKKCISQDDRGRVVTAEDEIAQKNHLHTLLREAVARHSVADVPVGAFLSGGIDSSLIVALMQANKMSQVKTYSIGFSESAYNEAPFAAEVAKHLKTDHTEYYVAAAEVLPIVERLPFMYDEPFSDSSQIPTFLVSQLARREVKVALSGDAGDELFCGYTRYPFVHSLSEKLQYLPIWLRKSISQILRKTPGCFWQGMQSINSLFPLRYQIRGLAQKSQRLAGLLNQEDNISLYNTIISHLPPQAFWLNEIAMPNLFARAPYALLTTEFIEQLMLCDQYTYLPDDILVKVDRASMATSLETRIPFLDKNIVQYAWQLPLSSKLRAGKSKYLLREILYEYVPRELIERPKQGFGVPLGNWMRGVLKEWASDLLSFERLKAQGMYQTPVIEKMWQSVLAGQNTYEYAVWNILMFQAWYENWVAGAAVTKHCSSLSASAA